jgi:hypothetical protein
LRRHTLSSWLSPQGRKGHWMKKHNRVKRPEFLEVRGIQYAVIGALMHWRENRLHELSCDQCGQPLTVLFGAREESDITRKDPRWWVPTGLTCACLLPKAATLVELPRRPHRPRQDKRQLEFQS